MSEAFRRQLRDDGVISTPDAVLTPLAGGVSSDIYRVDDASRVFVVKRALPQLRVEAEWHADVARNASEVAYLNCVRNLAPQNVPEVLAHRPDRGYFTMEFLGDAWKNWKATLLAGQGTPDQAREAGRVLGAIHRQTWDRPEIREQFETTANFHDLRLEPYLLATGAKHTTALRSRFEAEAGRIRETRRCLVHGDYSPKNLLFRGGRLMLLDCEVAWYGDPAFDVAFLLNHLAVKALHVAKTSLNLAGEAWQAYRNELGSDFAAVVEAPLPNLLPMLMLARVDGKSPLEYLSAAEQSAIRTFAPATIADPAPNLTEFLSRWADSLASLEVPV